MTDQVQEEGEAHTLNGRLYEEGWEGISSIPNERLPEELSRILVDFARGKYLDMKIIPGELVLEGSDFEFNTLSHIVYVKENIEHPEYKPGSFIIFTPHINNTRAGEPFVGMLKDIK